MARTIRDRQRRPMCIADVRAALSSSHLQGPTDARTPATLPQGAGSADLGDDTPAARAEDDLTAPDRMGPRADGPPGAGPGARDALAMFSAHALASDRHRARQLHTLAVYALTRILAQDDGEDALAAVFAHHTNQTATAEAGADDRLGALLGRLLPPADQTAVAAQLDTTRPLARRETVQALTLFLGMPHLLAAVREGRVRLNRWEKLFPTLADLTLPQLGELDALLAAADERLSLAQFLRLAARFVTACKEETPVTAASVRARRRLSVECLPDGEAELRMAGPATTVKAFYARARATATAVYKNQFESVDVMAIDRPDEGASDGGRSPDGGGRSPNGRTHGPADALDVRSGVRTDERTLQQLMFDVLIGAVPRTEAVLEGIPDGNTDSGDADGAGEDGERSGLRVSVSCPTSGAFLRQQATVVLTLPASSALGIDDQPGLIDGDPVPADLVREAAAHSTAWYRMLTDPGTGRALDESAWKYVPDKAARLAVQSKWQTCTAPGCTRPALTCEIDHGVPFDHACPENGGPTHPLNLHPLCKRCHQLKTAGLISMKRVGPDEIEWSLPLGVRAVTVAPDVGGPLPDRTGTGSADTCEEDSGSPTAHAAAAGANVGNTASAGQFNGVFDPVRIAEARRQAMEQLIREHEEVESHREAQLRATAELRAHVRARLERQEAEVSEREAEAASREAGVAEAESQVAEERTVLIERDRVLTEREERLRKAVRTRNRREYRSRTDEIRASRRARQAAVERKRGRKCSRKGSILTGGRGVETENPDVVDLEMLLHGLPFGFALPGSLEGTENRIRAQLRAAVRAREMEARAMGEESERDGLPHHAERAQVHTGTRGPDGAAGTEGRHGRLEHRCASEVASAHWEVLVDQYEGFATAPRDSRLDREFGRACQDHVVRKETLRRVMSNRLRARTGHRHRRAEWPQDRPIVVPPERYTEDVAPF